jgi:membrane protein YqaA with SNARE-associated domain
MIKKIRSACWVAFIWGLCEATFFFIVPDVWLTYVAITSRKKALYCCCFALVGALFGGLLIYLLGLVDYYTISKIFNFIPGISPPLQATVHQSLQEQGVLALLWGPIHGLPYKLYALNAAALEIPLVLFLLISIPARLIRFVLVTLLTAAVSRKLARYLTTRQIYIILGFFWIVFYTFYLYYFK